MPKLTDYTGQKIGRLTVISRAENDKYGVRWNCVCDCGKKKIVSATCFRSGHTKSCGCLFMEVHLATCTTHGATASTDPIVRRAYSSWITMRRRCGDEKFVVYANYGGRGIRVCERWISSFKTFLEDMGPPPTARHTVDRINIDGNYEPSNCRWATAKQQCRNTRSNRMLNINGVEKPMAQWAEEVGFKYQKLWSRVRRGLTGEALLQ